MLRRACKLRVAAEHDAGCYHSVAQLTSPWCAIPFCELQAEEQIKALEAAKHDLRHLHRFLKAQQLPLADAAELQVRRTTCSCGEYAFCIKDMRLAISSRQFHLIYC